jgi:hypothetical protein
MKFRAARSRVKPLPAEIPDIVRNRSGKGNLAIRVTIRHPRRTRDFEAQRNSAAPPAMDKAKI